MSSATNTDAARVRPRSKFYWALADGFVLAKRNLVQIPRIPELLVFATIQPVMFVLLFRYVFGGAIDVGGERLEVTLEQGGGLEDAARVLERYAHSDGGVRVDAERRYLVATVAGGAGLLAAVVRDLDAARVKVDELGLHRPTLDDVFLTLTGHAAEPDAPVHEEPRDEKEIA